MASVSTRKFSVFDKAKSQLVLNEPFFAAILLNSDIIMTDTDPSGQPLRLGCTDGDAFYFNPENVEKLTVPKCQGLIKHEVMHVANLHPWRMEGREPGRWNDACDIAINNIIEEEGGDLPDGGWVGASIAGFKGQSAEKIYNQLPPKPPGAPQDRDVFPAKTKGQAGLDKARAKIAQAKSVARAMGKLPRQIEEMIADAMDPKVDWTETLREFLTELTKGDYNWARPNRRFVTGDNVVYLPSMDGDRAMGKLGFLMDDSGSVSMDETSQFIGESVAAVVETKPSALVIAYCDVKVGHSDVFEQPSEAEVRERARRHMHGGTNMVAGLTWFKRNHPDVQAVVVCTDGETPWGEAEDFPFPVLWCITNKRYTAPWGVTVHVELDGRGPTFS